MSFFFKGLFLPKISSNLISINSLTNNNYIVLFIDNTALILSPIYKLNSNRIVKFRIVTSATRDKFDNLFRIKDLSIFLREKELNNDYNPNNLKLNNIDNSLINIVNSAIIPSNSNNYNKILNIPQSSSSSHSMNSPNFERLITDKNEKLNSINNISFIQQSSTGSNQSISTALNADVAPQQSTSLLTLWLVSSPIGL